MIDWIVAGALAAILMAEAVDAWALHQLARRCLDARPSTPEEVSLLRWHAEGFSHSMAIAGWLRGACLALALLAVCLHAHPLAILASLLLALAAHGERCFSAALLRRFHAALRPWPMPRKTPARARAS